MSLQKTLDEIKKVLPYAEEDTDSGAIETLAGRRARKTRAIDDLKRFKRQYKESLLRSAVFILVTGSEAKEFEGIAKEQFRCLSSPVESFYQDLANRVHPTLWLGKDTNANVFDVIGRHLEDMAHELDITGYPMLQFKAHYNRMANTMEEFVNIIRTAINEQVGGEMVGIYAVNKLVDEAIKNSHSATVTPIVMTAFDGKLALDLVPALERLSPRVFLVLAGKGSKELKAKKDLLAIKAATPENVEATLKTIKSSLKK